MQLKYKFLFLFSILFISSVYTQDVSLRIIAPDYEGKNVYLWVEDDYFTKHKEHLGQSVVENEECTFTISVAKISKIKIGIDYQFARMYVEPGAEYSISFPKHDESNNRSLAWNTEVMLSFLDLDDDDINSKVMLFNSDLDSFFSSLLIGDVVTPTFSEENNPSDTTAYSTKVSRKFSRKESLEKFILYEDSLTENTNVDSSFFGNYCKYAGASIAYSLGEDKTELYAKYFADKDIQYDNPEYALFFNEFYENYFDFYAYYPLSKKLKMAFESTNVKDSLSALIAEDTHSGNAQLQELILLKGLYDYRFQKPNLDTTILDVISSISLSSEYKENKKIANNYLLNISKGSAGSLFPDVEYISYTGDTLYLSEAGGQLIYLQIFASWSSSSIAELELMNQLYKRYNSKIRFISLSIDPSLSQFNAFIKKNRDYKWEFGWIGVHPESLRLLSVYDLPLFYLINEDFEILEWPALYPSTGIEKSFYEIELQEREDNKFRFWENQTNKSKREE